MLLAVHKCQCGDADCIARALVGLGQTEEELNTSIKDHWPDMLSDFDVTSLEIYERKDTRLYAYASNPTLLRVESN